MNTRGFVLALGMALCGLMAFTAPFAHSATITVTANAPDVLNGANASCALREAIQNINNGADTYLDCAKTGAAYGTSDTINLPAGTYTTTIAGAGELSNATGSLDILTSLTITGSGAGSTIIDGGAIDRVAYIGPGITVSISGVTIRNGDATTFGGSGGGIYNNNGTVTVTNSTISGNTATSGGGIYNWAGTLTVTNSTISGNTATTNGGGIDNFGTVTVTNSTISGNTTSLWGGGIRNAGTITVTNATIVRNAAGQGAGGGISRSAGAIAFANSIVADNGAGLDCVGAITDNGGNIDSDGNCGTFTQNAAMVQGTGFGALASNGGATQTHALVTGSVAIDTAPTCAGLTTDQRGTARPQGSACDIGAYEYGAVAVVAPVSGCTDYHATNYNPTATTGDGSCAYPDPDFGQVNLDFGTGKVDTSVQKTLTLKNTGPISTYIYGLHISGATFSIVNDSCSGKVVWLGNTCDIALSFNPSSAGPFTGILKVWTNAPKYKPLSVSLTGKATVSTVLSPATLITPADGATLAGTQVTFEWTAGSDATGAKVTDNAYVCERSDFAGCETPVLTSRGTAIPAAGLVIMLGLMAPFGLRNRRVRSVLLALIFLMAGGATLWACGGGSSSNADKSGKTLTLKAGTKYYWKVGTASVNGTVESEVRSFTTGK